MRSIQDLFAEAHNVFDRIKEATDMLGEADNPLLAILTQPAVNTLGHLSMRAQSVASESAVLRVEFQDTAQRLIDFLEGQGHAKGLKEAASIDLISEYFPTLRKPKIFDRRLEG